MPGARQTFGWFSGRNGTHLTLAAAGMIPALVGVIATLPRSAVVITNSATPRASVFSDTTRYPRFTRVVLLEQTAGTSANVSIGDLDADGHLDIVLAKGRHWPLANTVLFGNGHGHFGPARDLDSVADRSYSARLVDLDTDGDLDIVISNDRPDPKRVYLNDGTGTFHEGSTFGRREWPTRNASVADINGDGLPDIIVANRTGGRPGANYLWRNGGGGRFDASCIPFSEESATTITTADFDGNGAIDLAVPNRDGGQSYVYRNDGAGRFSTGNRIPFGPPDATMRMAEAGDLDHDGLLDIVAIDERHGVRIYFRQRDSTFASGAAVGAPGTVPYALAVVDVNLDGAIDIVVGNVGAASVVYFNAGSGRAFAPVPFGDGQGAVYGFAIADLDEDGHPDIAVARSGAPNAVYFAVPPSGSPK
jgi:hypothetical protein